MAVNKVVASGYLKYVVPLEMKNCSFIPWCFLYLQIYKNTLYFCIDHRLVGLVVKAAASRAEGPGFESRLRRDFFGVESYQ